MKSFKVRYLTVENNSTIDSTYQLVDIYSSSTCQYISTKNQPNLHRMGS